MSILLVDKKNIIIDGNNRIEELIGTSIDAIKGKSLNDIQILPKSSIGKEKQTQSTGVTKFSAPITIGDEEKIIHFECAPLKTSKKDNHQGQILFLQDETDIMNLHLDLQEHQRNNEELKQEFTKISQQYMKIQSEVTSIYNQLDEKQQIINTLNSNLTKLQSSLSTKEQELQAMQQTLSQSQQYINKFQKNLSSLFPNEMKKLTQLEPFDITLKNMKEKTSSIQRLEHQLKDMTTHLSQVLQAYDTTKDQIRIKDEILEESQEQLTKAHQQIQQLNVQLQQAPDHKETHTAQEKEPMTMKVDEENLIIPLVNIDEACLPNDQSETNHIPDTNRHNSVDQLDSVSKKIKKDIQE